ncbi:hypothetical protein I4U23_000311 [Adineta vaga]|nr:hypothetical protein I4U23_000311 [Adineta vaga]
MARMSFDTRSQNAWKELIEKESVTRISWHRKFQPTKNPDEWFKRAFYTQATSKPITQSLPTIVFPPRLKPRSNPTDTLYQLGQKLDIEHHPNVLKEMYPVKKEHQQILSDGFSGEEKGRYKYLKVRQEIAPDHKYQYPVSSSMEYGWKLDENAYHYQTPKHAQGNLIQESFYRTNGAFQ